MTTSFSSTQKTWASDGGWSSLRAELLRSRGPLQRAAVWASMLGFAVLIAILTANAFLATESSLGGGSDFALGWRAGGHYLAHEPLYSVERDGGRPYKYPPWTTVLYVPLALLSLDAAGLIWRLLTVISLVYSSAWTARRAGWPTTAAVAVAFWGFWNLNLIAGQPNVVWMAMCLWAFDRLEKKPFPAFAILLTALTGKWFQAVALVAVPRERFKLKPLLAVGALFLLVSIPVLWNPTGLSGLLASYRAAATGGAGGLGGSAYGLPILFMDALGLSRDDSGPRVLFFLPSALLAWMALRGLQRRQVSLEECFAAALGLSAAIHPMAYSYTFVFCLPLAACAISRALESGDRVRQGLALFGLLGIAGLNEKTSGALGIFVEAHQIKAIGTFALACSYLKGAPLGRASEGTC